MTSRSVGTIAAGIGALVLAAALGGCATTATGPTNPAGSTAPRTLASSSPTADASPGASSGDTAGCPAQPFPVKASTSTGPGVVLSFEPSSALVCRYSGLPDAGTLLGSAIVTSPSQLSQLRREVDQLTRVRAGQVFHCPNDDGTKIDVRFVDASQQLVLQFDQTGCQFVTSNEGSYRLPLSSTLLAQLKSLAS